MNTDNINIIGFQKKTKLMEATEILVEEILEIKLDKKFEKNESIRRTILSHIDDEVRNNRKYLLNGFRNLKNYKSFSEVDVYITTHKELFSRIELLLDLAIKENIILKKINIKPSNEKGNIISLKKMI